MAALVTQKNEVILSLLNLKLKKKKKKDFFFFNQTRAVTSYLPISQKPEKEREKLDSFPFNVLGSLESQASCARPWTC